jgi:hypothetical protein
MEALLEKLNLLAEYAELAHSSDVRISAVGALMGLAPHLVSLQAEMAACMAADAAFAQARIGRRPRILLLRKSGRVRHG